MGKEKVVLLRCNDEAVCEVSADDDSMGGNPDSCSNVYKYLEVDYYCTSKQMITS